MATPAPVITPVGGDGNAYKFVWDLTTADHTGVGTGDRFIQFTDLCIQAIGSNWGSATLSFEGTCDGATWFPMTNASGGSAVTFTTDGGKQSVERPLSVRPRLSVVGTAAVVKAVLIARRNPVK